MSENATLMRFPQPDGRVKVIDPGTGEVTFEEATVEEAPKPDTEPSPFDRMRSASTADVVHLPEPKQEAEPETKLVEAVAAAKDQYLTQGEAQAKLPQPDTTEKLATEASRKSDPLPYPVGAPEFREVLRLPRTKRAQIMKLYQNALDKWNRMPALGTALDTSDKLERYFEATVAFEQVLEGVAISPEAFRSWAEGDGADDKILLQTFFAYITRTGLGEV